jgi:hypothetical protein
VGEAGELGRRACDPVRCGIMVRIAYHA